MGHFGARPIRRTWSVFAFPALMLNYLGQGALVLDEPEGDENPFFASSADSAHAPMVFARRGRGRHRFPGGGDRRVHVAHQAMPLGYLPRLRLVHTSAKAMGQIYVPAINWLLLAVP